MRDIGGPAARPAPRPSAKQGEPPRRPRGPGDAGQDHPTEVARGWVPATTSNCPGGSLRNAAQASASARLSKGPCSSIVARSTTVNSGSHRGMPRKWLDRSYDFRAHSGQRQAP